MESSRAAESLNVKELVTIIGLQPHSPLYTPMIQHLINNYENTPGIHQIAGIHTSSIYDQSIGTSIRYITRIYDAVGSTLEFTDDLGEIARRFLAAINLTCGDPLYEAAFDSTIDKLIPPAFANSRGPDLIIAKLIQAWCKHVEMHFEYPRGTFAAHFSKVVKQDVHRQILPRAVLNIPGTANNMGTEATLAAPPVSNDMAALITSMSIHSITEEDAQPEDQLMIIENAVDSKVGQELISLDSTSAETFNTLLCTAMDLL